MVTSAFIRAEIARHRFYDQEADDVFRRTGVPAVDCILQNPDEVIALCEWMVRKNIQSYLEIGIWTGRMLTLMTRLFQFDKVAACDVLRARHYGIPVTIPKGVMFFQGSSQSREYEEWRSSLGHIDLVLIDGDHEYESVRRDFEINRRHSHRFLVFHDITGANASTVGAGRLWREIVDGNRFEIIKPQRTLGLPRSDMGIGIWSATEDVM